MHAMWDWLSGFSFALRVWQCAGRVCTDSQQVMV